MELITTWRYQVVGHRDAIEASKQILQAYKQQGLIGEEVVRVWQEQRRAVYQAQQAYNTIRTQMRLQHAEMIQTMRLMGYITSAGRALTYMWNTYSLAQLRIANAEQRHYEAAQKVAELEARYSQYVRDFGESSIFAQRALEELNEARERERRLLRELRRAQQQNIIGYAGMAMYALQFARAVGYSYLELKTLKATLLDTYRILREIRDISTAAAALTPLGAAAVGAAIVGYGAYQYWRLMQMPPEEREARIKAYEEYKAILRGEYPPLIDEETRNLQRQHLYQQIQIRRTLGVGVGLGATMTGYTSEIKDNTADTATHTAETRDAVKALPERLKGIFSIFRKREETPPPLDEESVEDMGETVEDITETVEDMTETVEDVSTLTDELENVIETVGEEHRDLVNTIYDVADHLQELRDSAGLTATTLEDWGVTTEDYATWLRWAMSETRRERHLEKAHEMQSRVYAPQTQIGPVQITQNLQIGDRLDLRDAARSAWNEMLREMERGVYR